jgi:hypothetical protein
MTKRRSSLTGSWSGAYRYSDNIDPETVFSAQIDEVGGAFIGRTQEPNLLALAAGSLLTAEIEGVRDGSVVTFTKFYDRLQEAIRYEGAVDDGLTRIEGRWTIRGSRSGTFFMVRDDEDEAAEAEEAAEATIEVRK